MICFINKIRINSVLHVENGAQFAIATCVSIPLAAPVFTVMSPVTKISAS